VIALFEGWQLCISICSGFMLNEIILLVFYRILRMRRVIKTPRKRLEVKNQQKTLRIRKMMGRARIRTKEKIKEKTRIRTKIVSITR
jgi:hypothetical protein